MRKVFFFHDLEVLYSHGAPAGMTTEGVYVPEAIVFRVRRELLVDLAPHRGRRQREVGAGYALRHRHDVRGNAVVLVAELLAGPAKATDHLVDDKQHAVALADLLDGWQVVLGRDDYPSSGDDRLHYHSSNRLGEFPPDEVLDLASALLSVSLRVYAGRATVEIGGRDVQETGRQRLVAVLALRLTGGRQSSHGLPVIGPITGDELPPTRLAVLLVVLSGYLEGNLVRLRAGVGVEKDIVTLEPLVQLLAQLDGREVAFSQRVEGHLL